eukprot:5201193-Prorocentrum_lima.AAC.1
MAVCSGRVGCMDRCLRSQICTLDLPEAECHGRASSVYSTGRPRLLLASSMGGVMPLQAPER